jgi:hypothetical protein
MIEYLLLFVNILSAIDIYRDSKKRPNGFIYPLLGLFLGIFGLMLYRFVFGGNVSLALKLEPTAGKIGPFYRLGLVFFILGSLFFLGGLAVSIQGQANLSAGFLVISGVITSLFGALFIRYDIGKRKKNVV